jgi:hypothetical protein
LIRHLRLPKLREDARQAQNVTLKDLEKLPPPLPENPVIELLRLLTAFSTEMKQWIDASEGHEALVQIFKSASADFKNDIFRTAPNFRPFKDADEEHRLTQPTIFDSGAAYEDPNEPEQNIDPMFLTDVREYIDK